MSVCSPVRLRITITAGDSCLSRDRWRTHYLVVCSSSAIPETCRQSQTNSPDLVGYGLQQRYERRSVQLNYYLEHLRLAAIAGHSLEGSFRQNFLAKNKGLPFQHLTEKSTSHGYPR